LQRELLARKQLEGELALARVDRKRELTAG
jgi:hypothetical protein